MMPASIQYFLVLLAGFCLGIVFYGGLWLTVRALPKSRHPAMLALGSLWGRTALVLAGFVLTTAGRWRNVAVCFAGLVLARISLRWFPNPAAGGTV